MSYPMRKVVTRTQVYQRDSHSTFGIPGTKAFRRWRLELACGHRVYYPFKEGRRKVRCRCRQCPED